MRKFIFTLLVSTGFCFSISAQSTGDYRSVANGNWNDLAKWETYNGSSWVSSITYPGQNPGTGKVIITAETEIKITGTVPYPAGLLIIDGFYYYDDNFNEIYTYGTLRFAAENTAALIISGDIIIDGRLAIENQNGAKTHNLSVGGSFVVGGDFSSISQDDRLAVTFNTTVPNSEINSTGLILFQDVIFDGMGISYETYVGIAGTATFIKGIVKHGAQGSPVIFYDDATASGSSGISFIDGGVNKIGDDPFTFPIGREEVYAPITMSAPVGQIETFNALYMRRSGAAIGAIADPGLYSISDCEYWFLSNLNGQSLDYPLNVTVGWTSAGACGLPADYIPDVSEVTLAHFNGNDWDNHGGIGAGTSTNGSVTWSGVTNSGVFSLGNVGTSCETPSGLAAFNITANSAMLSWDAVAGAVSYDVDYKVYNMWVRAATEITSTLFFLSGLSPLVGYDWRVQATCNLATSSARQATFMTTAIVACNDAYEPNNISTQARAFNPGNAISASLSSASDIDWFKLTTPNSSNTSLEVTLRNLPADYDLYVYNKNLVLLGSSTNAGNANEIVLYNSRTRKVTYYIKVVSKNGAYDISQCYTLLAQLGSAARSEIDKYDQSDNPTDIGDNPFLYPNPASSFVNLQLNSIIEGPAMVQILNTASQLVKVYPVNITKGHNQVRIPVNDIRPGVYLLRISKGELNIVRRFMKAR